MKYNPHRPTEVEHLVEAHPANRPVGFRVSRWQRLADFRTPDPQVRQHQPSGRIRYSMLRSLTTVFVFLGQFVLQGANGGMIDDTQGLDLTKAKYTFDKPGKVDVYCSLHQNMHCVVLVMDNPYFALSNRSGRYTISNVPPGKYSLKARHERLPVAVQEITLTDDGVASADFTLTPAAPKK
jgi:hypothetical protein